MGKIISDCNRSIKLCDKNIGYILKTSKRAKRLRIAVYCDSSFVAIKPMGMSENIVEKFIFQKTDWILSKLEYFKKFKGGMFRGGRADYLKRKDGALKFVNERIDYFNKIYNFKFNKIDIKNQKTRWGSCSKKGNLNFNYRILFLSKRAADYIVVHELCHLKEFNHSRKFWNLVAKTVPDYLNVRKELRRKGLSYY